MTITLKDALILVGFNESEQSKKNHKKSKRIRPSKKISSFKKNRNGKTIVVMPNIKASINIDGTIPEVKIAEVPNNTRKIYHPKTKKKGTESSL